MPHTPGVMYWYSQTLTGNGPSHPLKGGDNAFTLINPVERNSRFIGVCVREREKERERERVSVCALANGQCKAKPVSAICLTALSHPYGTLSHTPVACSFV